MRHNGYQTETSVPARKWIAQAGVLVGVLLLIVVVLILKNRASEPVPIALNEPQSVPGQEGQGTAMPQELPHEQLDRLLAVGQPTLAFFHSNNCVECTKMIKIVADVYPEFEDVVALVDVNVYDPQNRVLLQQARIQYIPTQIFYNAAGEGKLTVGAMPAQVFRAYMRTAAGQE
jgi:thiol:disulfide interchange protein